FLVRAEIKPNFVPTWSVVAALVLALVNFAILLPYVGYMFEVMRAETLVGSIRRQAKRELARAVGHRRIDRHRASLLTCISQVTDIALGSIVLSDVPVCVLTIDVLGQFLADDYTKAKARFGPEWFAVGHSELQGSSDQVIAEVNRGHTFVEYLVMSSFVDLAGITPIHRKEAVHEIALATRDLGLEAESHDPRVTRRLAHLLVKQLAELVPNARPIGLNGLFKAVVKLAFWAMAEEKSDLSEILVAGIAAAPPDFVESALSRMETMQSGLFWEVNERVIAFDWVEEPLRAQIPRLREALSLAKAGGPRRRPAEPEAARPDLVSPEAEVRAIHSPTAGKGR